MPTDFIHRVLCVIPSNRIPALNAWVKNNLDAQGSDWFVSSLSASGNPPATHAWASFALNENDGALFLSRLVMQAAINPPDNWQTMSRQEKKTWLLQQRNTVRSRIGVWIVPMFNDDVWDNPQDALDAMGLKLVTVNNG